MRSRPDGVNGVEDTRRVYRIVRVEDDARLRLNRTAALRSGFGPGSVIDEALTLACDDVKRQEAGLGVRGGRAGSRINRLQNPECFAGGDINSGTDIYVQSEFVP